jgi:hypothetical protein
LQFIAALPQPVHPPRAASQKKMLIHRCTSRLCGRPFQLNPFQFSAEVTLPWKRGEITCPHCGMLMMGEASSVYLAHALTPAQERDFDRRACAPKDPAHEGGSTRSMPKEAPQPHRII